MTRRALFFSMLRESHRARSAYLHGYQDLQPRQHLSMARRLLAGELAAGAPLAQRLIKAGLDRSFEMSFEESLSYEQAVQAVLLASEDFFEGAASFLQKRDPDFRGR